MANITKFYFLTVFDEFKNVDTDKIDAYLDIATLRVPSTIWNAATNYATALLTAHMLSTSGALPGQGAGSAGGAVTDESVGDVSRSFATVGVAGSGDEELRTTRYGIDFLRLRKENIQPKTPASGPLTIPPPGYCPIPGGSIGY